MLSPCYKLQCMSNFNAILFYNKNIIAQKYWFENKVIRTIFQNNVWMFLTSLCHWWIFGLPFKLPKRRRRAKTLTLHLSKDTNGWNVTLLSLGDSASPTTRRRRGVLIKWMSEIVCKVCHATSHSLCVCSIPLGGKEYCCWWTRQPFSPSFCVCGKVGCLICGLVNYFLR